MNSRNRLWVATTNGIGIYDENTNQWLAYVKYKEPYGEVTYITEDAEGVMWFGTTHGVFEANVSGRAGGAGRIGHRREDGGRRRPAPVQGRDAMAAGTGQRARIRGRPR